MTNLITTPRFWKNKAVLVKSETAYGTDAAPTGAVNWIEARNVSFTPYDAETEERNVELPYMGSSGKVISATWGKLAFDVLVAGSGTAGTAPKWASLVMACGTAETLTALTSVAYNLVSSGFGSITAWVNMDGVYHKLTGGRGTFGGKFSAKGVPMFSFEFDLLYAGPLAAALPAATRTGWLIDEAVNAVNTTAVSLNGVDLAFSACDFALNNRRARISLPGPQLEVMVTDRAPSMTLTVLAPPLAAFDPFALAALGTNIHLTLTHGTETGAKVKVDARGVLVGLEYAEVDGLLGYRLSLDLSPAVGNDELAITCL